MTTYVLVHGAWGGSYGWKEFAPLLRERGHEVYTPSLTGLGEREHLSGPQINLSLTSRTSLTSSTLKTCTTSYWSATATAAWW